ncbi:oligosaccharide flippase family protein, partial [Acinetobacter baumannii]
MLLAAAAFPTWLLTGLERMRDFSIIQISARCVTLALVVILVRSPSDAPLMIAANAVAGICAGAATILWLRRSALLTWRRPTFRQIRHELRDG